MTISEEKTPQFPQLDLLQCPQCRTDKLLQWQPAQSQLLCPCCASRYAVHEHQSPTGAVLMPDLLEPLPGADDALS